ncbi:MAG: hypothetical protein J7639_33405 [Paenibacillaceae bacterium]|nr:hypothetical protein [Paenibacillaceae bacterium]
MLPVIVLIVLSFCIFFGLGFIVNMLLKTTWLPIYLYVIVIGVIIAFSWDSSVTVSANLLGYKWTDMVPLLCGLGGAIVGGYTIRQLRVKGYKMF